MIRYQVKKAVLKILFIIYFLNSFNLLYAQASEYKLKAVFLERFTRFIEWPDNSDFSDSTKPFIITVIGENPFGKTLDELYEKTKIKNKKVQIKYIKDIKKIDSCHILFISASMSNSLDKILDYTRTRPILTIGDHPDFALRGVIINFFIKNKKVRFEINEKSLEQSRLYISYLLLNAATIIHEEEGGGK